jgi:hypothetical protein
MSAGIAQVIQVLRSQRGPYLGDGGLGAGIHAYRLADALEALAKQLGDVPPDESLSAAFSSACTPRVEVKFPISGVRGMNDVLPIQQSKRRP